MSSPLHQRAAPSVNSDYSNSEAGYTPQSHDNLYDASSATPPHFSASRTPAAFRGSSREVEQLLLKLWEDTVPYLPSEVRQPLYESVPDLERDIGERVRHLGEGFLESKKQLGARAHRDWGIT